MFLELIFTPMKMVKQLKSDQASLRPNYIDDPKNVNDKKIMFIWIILMPWEWFYIFERRSAKTEDKGEKWSWSTLFWPWLPLAALCIRSLLDHTQYQR